MSRQRRTEDDRPGRRIVGPQSALTDFLASRNISSRQIEADFQARREAAARQAAEEQAAVEANGAVPATSAGRATQSAAVQSGTPTAEEATAFEADREQNLTARQKKVLEKIKLLKKKKKKGKGRGKKRKSMDSDDEDEGEDDDDDEEYEDAVLELLKGFYAPQPGQMENCGRCGKRFTVTPYSRADESGGLLCNPCGKLLDKDKRATGRAKKKARASDGPVGRRRKTQSRILDGASPVGPKPLVTLCVEHLSRNIHLADDLGDLPAEVVDRIARMLSKRRLLNARTVDLFIRPAAEEISIYDGGELGSGDYLRMIQAMPRLRALTVYNAIQFKDEVMAYLTGRDVALATLRLYGANLLSDEAWKGYLVEKGAHLRTLHICDTDRHVTEAVVQYIAECAPGLERLKIKGNQALGSGGLAPLGGMAALRHVGLGLARGVSADAVVQLVAQRGAQLQTLSVRKAEAVDNAVLAALHEHGRQLRKLRITDNGRCTDAGFVQLFTDWANPPLVHIDLAKVRHDDAEEPRGNAARIGLCGPGFQALMAHSGAALQHLGIESCRHIEAAAFEAVFAADQTYPELRRIEASFCEELTDHIVCSMFRSCPNLKELVTFGCMKVTGVVPQGRVVVGVPNALGMQTVGED